MTSSFCSYNPTSNSAFSCTTVSTFEKPKSLRCKIIFGDYCKKTPQISDDTGFINADEYIFIPNQIFGLSYEATGREFKKFHVVLVLRACAPGENGTIVPGIIPGAEVLVKTSTTTGIRTLSMVLEKLVRNRIDLTKITASNYRHLNNLLSTSSRADFFVGELLAQ